MTAIIICLLAMLLLQMLSPFWWWVMIVPFAYGVAAARSGGRALLNGLISAGLLWLGGSLYFLLKGGRIIAGRMAHMFGLGRAWPLVVVSALIAAVAAAVSGYAGFTVRALFKKASPKVKTSSEHEGRST